MDLATLPVSTGGGMRFWILRAPLLVAISMALTAGLIVVLRPLLMRYAMVRPNSRSSHVQPTPQGGGVAVVGAVLLATGVAMLASAFPNAQFSFPWPVMAAVVVMAGVGAVDDLFTIAVGPRLVFQAACVFAIVLSLPEGLRVWPAAPQIVETALLVLGGLWFVNLVNFMDGIDLMTVAEFVPVSAGLVVAAMIGGLPATGAVVALTLFGALLGFAPFNWPVARLFLGDVGSLPLGLLVGWLLALLSVNGHVFAALILPLYYLADATFTLLRRLARGAAVTQAHRDHYYQRAIDAGLPVLGVIARVLITNFILAGLAVATIAWPSRGVGLAMLALGGLAVGVLMRSLGRAGK
ncbi:MAG: glycosyl transferase [Proteobacteria bacterium]|nr:glycosyl transferase [Pseudomonadota bacterium]